MSGMRAFRIAIPVSDINRSRAFYEHLLDCPADDTVPSRLYFHGGGFIVAVIDWAVENHGVSTPVRPLPDSLYFATEDIIETRGRAAQAGAVITKDITLQPWGERSFYCTDPDGHPLCFVAADTLFLGAGADWA